MKAVDSVDTALTLAVVDELEPLDSAFTLGARKCVLGRIAFAVLLDSSDGVGRALDLVEVEGGCNRAGGSEEVITEDLLETLKPEKGLEDDREIVHIEGKC